jgi:lactate permease
MHWTQNYDPAGNLLISCLMAALPIIFFFWALAFKKMKGHYAGLLTVLLAVLVSLFFYRIPLGLALESVIYGGAVGIWPIGWIIVAAVFLYKLTVKSGQFEVIRNSIASITEDRRLQALLIAFSFGAFLEGAAGFGTPVAISAAILVGLGFNPLYAAGLCLIANTAPVAFGAIGIPVITAGKVTGIDPYIISQMVGRQLPLLSVFVPFWLVFIMSGWKKTIEVLPAILVSGFSFAITQYLTSNFLGPELPDIASSIVSMLALGLFLKVWKPKSVFQFKDEMQAQTEVAASTEPQKFHDGELVLQAGGKVDTSRKYTAGQIIKSWSPFLVLIVMVTLWGGVKSVKSFLDSFTMQFPVPGLDKAILKAQPIVDKLTPYAAQYKFDILAAAGSSILATAVITKFILAISWKSWFQIFGETLKELRYPLIMIASVLGLGYIANYSGISATLGLGFATTGKLFPFFSPFLGWLGVFLTGSDTSSNALFGNLQKITAHQIGVDPSLTVAANSSGGVTGKMISPQSIAVATASTGLIGKEGDLFRFTIKHSLLFAVVIGIITYVQAYLWSWMIP